MNSTIRVAPVRQSVIVDATPEHAFDVFTAKIDRWWPKTHGIGASPIQQSVIEPFVGGRWYTRCEDGTDVVIGHVLVWQPGARLVVTWEVNAAWKPDARVDFASEIEARFIAEAAGGTRLELEHRNFERMGVAEGETMRSAVDSGWPALLQLFSAEASTGT
jgi:uncharacterized protein YndB with AHSA1/START domain